MRRLSIEVTPDQHQRLKAIAALQGKSIKEYVLERALPPPIEREGLSEAESLRALEAFLAPRIDAAKRGELSTRSPGKIFDDVVKEKR